jgi:hypothetical protein
MNKLIEKATRHWKETEVNDLKEAMRQDWIEGLGFERFLNGEILTMPDFMARRLMWISTLAFLGLDNE